MSVKIRKERKEGNNGKPLMLALDNKAIILLIVISIVAQIASSGLFFRGDNISSVIRQTAVSCLMTLGFVPVLTAGMIDLSVGYMMSLVIIVYSQAALVLPVPIAILIALATGLASGAVNGLLSVKLNLQPFILTLGTGQIFRGIAYVMCGGISINVTDGLMKYLGQGVLFGFLPMTLIIVVVITAITMVLMSRTKFGRHVVATGGNLEAARVSGINIAKTKILAFVYIGFTSAIAAIVLAGRIGIAMPNGGAGMEMDAIAAAIIGGTSLSGGKPNVIGAIFGALVLGIISNLLNLSGVNSFWQWFSKGAIIVFAIFLDSRTEYFIKNRQLAA